jgi:MoxR-like ATPase
MFNVLVDYPSETEELEIMRRTTSAEKKELTSILKGDEILRLQDIVRRVPISDHVTRYAMRLTRATRLRTNEAPDFVKEWLSWGAGPRACQYLILGGKARALLHGRHHVSTEDIAKVAHPVLRHRLITNFNAEAEGITTDKIIDRLLEYVDAGEVAAAKA